jgi:AraC family transcriptional regulator
MDGTPASIHISPDTIVKRQSAAWRGIAAEIVQLTQHAPFEYHLQTPFHTLIALHRAERRDGETVVDGLPPSTRRQLTKKLTFVPAGHGFHGWQDPRALTRATIFYLDRDGPLLDPELRFGDLQLAPRLYFDEPSLWETAVKLSAEVERGEAADHYYAEALSIVLMTEIVRLERGAAPREPSRSGGLAAWQQRLVEEHIEAHLAEPLSLVVLAEMARLSPRHFTRAFKQSFGRPPHHYHLARRIDQAKALLAAPEASVTDIAVRLGFADTSAFSTTFRKMTGAAPRDYRRRLT